ncbi:SWI/SNF-related matrix-associated actin-dependent regulator of chromatin subfamily E member 1-like [Dendronephthya gigantea]|uniref:SWI/SNF-related matrix-associated actin-dependent regulator of chromatin subfamily E member 1-like n=1 Tax=Dendronephthya gigantea TaxID=151771 RepID=UPI00106A61AD|nr:SWI/SNF-related matrix-associated actin-dependent regulator of chromatin subfamily E member 1-like [Dendronephthya gigantea]
MMSRDFRQAGQAMNPYQGMAAKFRPSYQPPSNSMGQWGGSPGMNQNMFGLTQQRFLSQRPFLPGDFQNTPAPKAPDKPLMPYMRFSRKVWEQVKNQNPEGKLWDIGKIIGQMWRDLPDEERQVFFDEYELDKVQYNESMKAYHNSQEYQQWIAAKGRAQQALQEQQARARGIDLASFDLHDARFSLEPIIGDDEEDLFSVKHVAASRFHRNQKLMADIFSDIVVPDLRTVVTTSRIHMLRKQVKSLGEHQKKLEAELQQIEENFQTKKRKFVESSESFREAIKKSPKITETKTPEVSS